MLAIKEIPNRSRIAPFNKSIYYTGLLYGYNAICESIQLLQFRVMAVL